MLAAMQFLPFSLMTEEVLDSRCVATRRRCPSSGRSHRLQLALRTVDRRSHSILDANCTIWIGHCVRQPVRIRVNRVAVQPVWIWHSRGPQGFHMLWCFPFCARWFTWIFRAIVLRDHADDIAHERRFPCFPESALPVWLQTRMQSIALLRGPFLTVRHTDRIICRVPGRANWLSAAMSLAKCRLFDPIRLSATGSAGQCLRTHRSSPCRREPVNAT